MTVHDRPGALQEIGALLEAQRPRSVLLACDPRAYEACGAAAALDGALSRWPLRRVEVTAKVPQAADIHRLAERIRGAGIDFIVAVGGGTVLDTAKAAAVWPLDAADPDMVAAGAQPLAAIAIPKLLVPTTAGTGAEATPFAVVYVGTRKHSLVDPRMPGEQVILAPELTYSLPPRLTAETGCDALAQAIESHWSLRATAASRIASRQALELALGSLQAAVNRPDPASRRAMLTAAHLSGRAIAVSRTTAAHSLSYPMTARFGIAHGHAVMLTLPHFFPGFDPPEAARFRPGADPIIVERSFRELLQQLGVVDGAAARDRLLALMDEIHLETRLSRLGIDAGGRQAILDEGFTADRIENHPLQVDRRDAEAILAAIA